MKCALFIALIVIAFRPTSRVPPRRGFDGTPLVYYKLFLKVYVTYMMDGYELMPNVIEHFCGVLILFKIGFARPAYLCYIQM